MLLLIVLACQNASIKLGGLDTAGVFDTATSCDSRVDRTLDCDGDGYSPEDGDCADQNSYVNPAMPEDCNDNIDNNCDAFVDETDADCLDDIITDTGDSGDTDDSGDDSGTEDSGETDGDRDADGVPDSIDPLFALDGNGDGLRETMCVVGALSMTSAYADEDAIRVGNPSSTWGGFDTVDVSQTDVFGEVEEGAWCYNFGTSGLETTRYRYLYAASASHTTFIDLESFCDVYRDEFCVQFDAGSLGMRWVVSVELQSDGSIRGGN